MFHDQSRNREGLSAIGVMGQAIFYPPAQKTIVFAVGLDVKCFFGNVLWDF
jgi:hypothetical protein